MKADILVQDEGTISLFHPETADACEFLQDMFDGQFHGQALVVEHSYVNMTVARLRAVGFTVGELI